MTCPLKVVATPIGNIQDISRRAIRELQDASAIFAEDTRHTLQLIHALGITLSPQCRLISCNAHNEEKRIAAIVERLRKNDSVVLVSDAGCPTISDPGSRVVQGVIEHGFEIEIIPGPSAHTSALMGAGIDTTRFAFLGFLPQKKSQRKELILSSARAGLAVVIYESPRRINDLLAQLFEFLGPQRVVVARELTKLYETFHRGVLGSALSPALEPLGECVVIVEAQKADLRESFDESEISAQIETHLKSGDSLKEVAHKVAVQFKLPKRLVYNKANQIKNELDS